MDNMLGGLKGFISSLFGGGKLENPNVSDWDAQKLASQLTQAQYGGVKQPERTVSEINLPPINKQTPLFNPNVSTESARPIVSQIVEGYKPSGVSQDYRSPMADYVDLMSSLFGATKLDPRILPLIAASENGLLAPGTAGVRTNNPFSTIINGELFKYPDIGTAIERYVGGMTGPVTPQGQPRNPGERYLMYQGIDPSTTLGDFLMMHNPEDNPEQQMNTILSLATQLGL